MWIITHKYEKILDLFLYAAVLMLPFMVFLTVFELVEISYSAVLICLTFTICYGYLSTHKKTRKINTMISICFLVLIVIGRNYITEGFQIIYNQMITIFQRTSTYHFVTFAIQSESEFSMYFLIVFIYVIWMRLLQLSWIQYHSRFITFILSLSIISPCLLYQVRLPWKIMGCLMVSWVVLFFSRKYNWKYLLISGLCGTCLVMSMIYLLPPEEYKIHEQQALWRKETRIMFDRIVYDVLNGEYSKKNINNKIDLRDAKNRGYTGAVRLIVTDEKEDVHYLKSQIGVVYEDNSWNLLPNQVYEGLEFSWEDTIFDYTRNQNETHKIILEDHRIDQTHALIPYDAVQKDEHLELKYDQYAITNQKTLTYIVSDEAIYKNNRQYESFVKEYYLQLDESKINYFQNVLKLKEFESDTSTSTILLYLQQYLEEVASYTLSPGSTPGNQDFVEYFLSDNQKGYCVHFATAATLMLRYYGIPTRYVEGYRVNENRYSHGVANVLDEDAHAWVEIYSASEGWIVVEVTPAAQQETNSTQLPVIPQQSENIVREPNQQNTFQPHNQQQKEMINEHQPDLNTEKINQKDEIPLLIVSITLVTFILLSLFMIWLQRKVRYAYKDKKMHQKDARKAVQCIYEYMLCLQPYGAVITEEMKLISDEAYYSQHVITNQHRNQMLSLRNQVCRDLMKRLTFSQKMKLMYLNALR